MHVPHGRSDCGQQFGSVVGQSTSVVHAVTLQSKPQAVVSALQQCSPEPQSSIESHRADVPGQLSVAAMQRGGLVSSTQHSSSGVHVLLPQPIATGATSRQRPKMQL